MENTATKNPGASNVQVTVEQLNQALSDFARMSGEDLSSMARVLAEVPDFGAVMVVAFTASAKTASGSHILYGVGAPAFVIGVLVGRQQS
jgi:hypothetical protein